MTRRQLDLLRFVRSYILANDGIAPSFEEMRDGIGVFSKSSVHRLLVELERQGFITKNANKHRQIALVPGKSLPEDVAAPRASGRMLSAFTDGLLLEECARRGLLAGSSI